jgi:uncharacterized damage-inducible protein DinB
MQKENFKLLAQYNQSMNEKLFDAAARLKRFAIEQNKFSSLDNIRKTNTPESPNIQLYDNLESLHAARQRLDADIINFCNEITTEQLAKKLDYKNCQGKSYSDQVGLLIRHLFNHQTHHRGQITTLLSQAGIDVGNTDLLVCIKEME